MMADGISLELIDTADPSWPRELERLRTLLGAPNNPYLFPYHFLVATFPRLGGEVVEVRSGGEPAGIGWLFPAGARAGIRHFTVRFHWLGEDRGAGSTDLTSEIGKLLGGAEITWYEPQASHEYARTDRRISPELSIGRPSAEEARQARALQHDIWGAGDDSLYPSDIYSLDFGLPISLVARVDGQVVGFSFGFHKFDYGRLIAGCAATYAESAGIESQILGVAPSHRSRNIGYLMKLEQADILHGQNVTKVTWTVDPMQFLNAVLNFAKLGAVAIDYYPDYFPSWSALTSVSNSRLRIEWHIGQLNIVEARARPASNIFNLRGATIFERVNHGYQQGRLDAGKDLLAIEIPSNWAVIQQREREIAKEWSRQVDRLLAHYMGRHGGHFVVRAVGKDGDRCYLLAERRGGQYLAEYGHQPALAGG